MLTKDTIPLEEMKEGKEGKEEEFDDDDSSSSTSSSNSNNANAADSNAFKLNIYSDPLSLINPHANLDDVLNAKTIGEVHENDSSFSLQ